MTYSLTVEIESFSHELSQDTLNFFHLPGSGINAECVNPSTCKITFNNTILQGLERPKQTDSAYIIAQIMLVTMNIVTQGFFTWVKRFSLDPIVHENRAGEESRDVSLSVSRVLQIGPVRKLERDEVRLMFIIFGSIARDLDTSIRNDYTKGVLLLSQSHYDINFYKEAFFNFYRCIEGVVTRKYLNTRKLNNELKEISSVLQSIGCDEGLLGLFKEIYKLRGSEVAHSQKAQKDITYDVSDQYRPGSPHFI
ncbi:hypothetical protein ACFOEW_07540 [Alteromonas oceani]|uniref:Apea-like HEPN domain-containing protein n=1 Tax=Alteromonas oceani TaxID=2071609 RepID=A0ABV7JUA9_9ALTE|nr:hypothetical protein [Alteromonas oceani]